MIGQKTCVTWIYATTACQLNVCSGYSGTWRQMPLPLRSLCRRSRSQGEEYCPSSTPCTTRSTLQYLLCSKGEKYCSRLSIWENGQRTKKKKTPSLGRPPPYRDDKSVDTLERLSHRVAEPFRAPLLPP